MTAPVRPDDPLAGYTPDWRQRDAAAVLAEYTPDWRTRTTAPRDATQTPATLPRNRIRLPQRDITVGPRDDSPRAEAFRHAAARTTAQAALAATPVGTAVNAARIGSNVVGVIEGASDVVDDVQRGKLGRAAATGALAALPFVGKTGKAIASLSDLKAAHAPVEIDVAERVAQAHELGAAGLITLPRIVVPEAMRGQGLGSAAMQDLTQYADETGQRIALTPSTDFGATSRLRLESFYRRFGFVPNRGRAKDFATQEAMIRPARPASRADSAVVRGARLAFPAPRREGVGTPFTAPVDDGADPRLANLAKLGVSPEAEAKVRESYARLGLTKKTVTHEETKAVATELGINPQRLIARGDRLSGAELLAVRDVVSQNAERIVALSKQAADPALARAEKDALEAQIGTLSGENDAFLVRYTKERSRAGRDLNALKIIARSSMELPVWQLQAQRVKGGLPLSPEENRRVIDLTAANDRDGLIRYVAGLHKSTGLDKALTLWKAGLLTNPVTHLVNATSNAGMAAMETAKEPLAGAIDAVISLARGTPRTKAVSARGLLAEPLKGAWGARHRVIQTLKHGSADELAKWDFRKTNFGESPAGRVAQAYTDAVFNSLSASDQAFKAAAVGRSIEEQIRVRARMAADPRAELARLRAQPDPDMLVQAIADAEYATFQSDNVAATAVTAAKKALGDSPTARIATEVTMPFVRTPTNVAARLVDYSPIGFATTLARQVKTPSQKRLAEDLARNLTGSGVVALGFMLAVEGKATGAAPKDPTERAQWELEGKQANSVLINGRWRNVSRVSPIGSLVAVGAQMHGVATAAKSREGAIAAAAYAPARVALDQSFLKGVSGTLGALNDPARFGEQLMEQTAGSVVPAGVAAVARAVDPLQRDPSGAGEAIAARIPGVSRSVSPRLNAFGKGVPSSGAGGRSLYDIFQSRPASADPLVQELARVGATVGMPGKSRTIQKVRETRSDEEYRAFLQESGPAIYEALQRTIAKPAYQADDVDGRRERIERAVRDARSEVATRERRRLKLARRGTPAPTELGTPR